MLENQRGRWPGRLQHEQKVMECSFLYKIVYVLSWAWARRKTIFEYKENMFCPI